MNLSSLKKSSSLLLRSLVVVLGCAAATGTGCARNVTGVNAKATTLVLFKFSVQGKLALNNPNITYYIVLNAPEDVPGQTLDPTTNGPRFNGPSLDVPSTILKGRLPFIGLLPGDIESKWTDFYYIQGSASGTPVVGRGIRQADGTPLVRLSNYPSTYWMRLNDDSTFQIYLKFEDLFDNPANKPANMTVNLGVGDNIDLGQGYVFDTWRANIPFAIKTEVNTTPQAEQDPSTLLNSRQIPGRPLPQLPAGVDQSSVNITGYEYTVRQQL